MVLNACDLDPKRRRHRRRASLAQAVIVESAALPGEFVVSESLLRLGLLGAPLVGADAPWTNGSGLAAVVGACGPSEMRDRRQREAQSVAIRRAARREAEQRRLIVPWRPSISVLVVSDRPAELEHVLDGLKTQSMEPNEVVFGFHGAAWNADDVQQADDALPCRTEVVMCESALNLSEVLSVLANRTTGDVVTTWNDDDWYGSHHIEDLVDALAYSGADLVGKAEEFVWLESSDVTVRRVAIGAETASRMLAGATLMCRRSTLNAVGGLAAERLEGDRGLTDAIVDAGGTVYRTHGFEYLLRCRSDQSTLQVPDGYFLRDATEARAGLDLGFSGIDR